MGTVTDWAHLEQGEHIELDRPHQMGAAHSSDCRSRLGLRQRREEQRLGKRPGGCIRSKDENRNDVSLECR